MTVLKSFLGDSANALHRRLPLAVIALVSLAFAALVVPGTSRAWTNNSQAYNLVQTPSWGNAIATDGLGNSYVAISVKNTFTIGSVSTTVGTSFNYLILKTDRTGTAVWGTTLNLDGWGDITGMKADSVGNVYITGKFSGSVTLGSTTINSAGGKDIFVAKLNTSGTVAWVQSFGGSGQDSGNGIGLDAAGNIYIAGTFQSSVAFGSTTLTTTGSNDIFLAKLNSSGNPQWATKAGGTADDNGGWMQNLAVDSSGNSFISGVFQNSMSIAGSTLTSAGSRDAFIGKVNSSGVWQWGAIGGSTNADDTNGVALDGQGGAYLTGVYGGAATFGSASLTHSGSEDVFIARINSAGTWQWARSVQGTNSDYVVSVDADSSGGPVIAGYFYSSTLNTGNSSLTYSGGSGADAWVAKWNLSGTFQWSKHMGGTEDDGFYGVAVDSDNNIRATGWAGRSNSVSFDGGTPISIMSGCTSECWSYVEWTLSQSGGLPTATTTTTTTSTVAPNLTTTTTLAPSQSTTSTTATSNQSTTTTSMVSQSAIPTIKKTVSPAKTASASSEVRTTIASSTTTSLPASSSTSEVPEISAVTPGDASATIDGKVEKPVVTKSDNRLIVSTSGVSAAISSIDSNGKVTALDGDGNLRLIPGDLVEVQVSGSAPNEDVDTWLFSTPQKLGSIRADALGKGSNKFVVPADIASGNHRLAIDGQTATGAQATVTIGVLVGEVTQTSKMSRVLITIPILLAVAGGLLIPISVRRRRRD